MERTLQVKRRFCLSKNEKIKKNSLIKRIIWKGDKYKTHILDCFYFEGYENKIAVIVPKKKLKFATDRNTIKRKIREAYRLNKYLLNKKKYCIVFIYKHPQKRSFKDIEITMINVLLHLELTA